MLYLNDLGLLCTLGSSADQVRETLLVRGGPVPVPEELMTQRYGALCGELEVELPPLPAALASFDCRNNRLAAVALEQIRPSLDAAIERYSSTRIAVVMGTSTSGIKASEEAVRAIAQRGEYPPEYHAVQGILGGLGEFVAAYLGLSGPVSTLSTACSSSANALLTARRLLQLDLCDAVVVGGVDSLCELTISGFGALEALSGNLCRPFSGQRDGINIGEAAAVFLMSDQPGPVRFVGGAASSDAHHISAPHPEGDGAYAAMKGALEDAGLTPDDIDYLNAHGTGTPHNDIMESKAINRLFGSATACSSTKSMTGHTLGASGSLELAFCWLLLSEQGENWRLPPSLYREEKDVALAPIRLTQIDEYFDAPPRHCMSNSFAFGGSNVSLVIAANSPISSVTEGAAADD